MTPCIPTRLRWDGSSCLVRHGGVEIVLPFRPPIFGKEVAEIDYAPTMRTQQIRESSYQWRDMTAAEADSAHAWMTLLAADVLAAASRLAKG